MGDDLDRGMHRRAATARRDLFSRDWTEGPGMGSPAAAPGGFRRIAAARALVRNRARSLPAGRSSIARRRFRRGARRHGAARHRRCHPRHRAFQSRTGNRRHHGRNRRFRQHDLRGLFERPLRQRDRVPRIGGCRHHRLLRLVGSDARDAADIRAHRFGVVEPTISRGSVSASPSTTFATVRQVQKLGAAQISPNNCGSVSACDRVMAGTKLKLPRFRGHPTVWVFGVHNGKEAPTLRAAPSPLPAAPGRAVLASTPGQKERDAGRKRRRGGCWLPAEFPALSPIRWQYSALGFAASNPRDLASSFGGV
jgi:hypothetical protein